MYNSPVLADELIYSSPSSLDTSVSPLGHGGELFEVNMPRSKEEIKAYKKIWYTKNRDRIRVSMAKYYIDNKESMNAKNKQWRIDNQDKVKASKSTPEYKEYIKSYLSDYQKDPRNKVKHSARTKVSKAVNSGKLERLPCEVCGNPKSEGHHDDYSKPLNVRWLCKKHHTEHHNLEGKNNEQ